MKEMKLVIVVALLVTGLLTQQNWAFAAEMRVYRLGNASAESVARICETLFAGQLKAVAAPGMNAVIIRTTDNQLFADIEKLIAVLDRKPATFRFSVRSISDQQTVSSGVGGNLSDFSRRQSTRKTRSEKIITALEMTKASISEEQMQIFRFVDFNGVNYVPFTVANGLKISGQLRNGRRVMVQLWYSQKTGINTSEQLLTEIEVTPGEWFTFGGLSQHSDNTGSGLAINRQSGSISATRNRLTTDKVFEIKVDLVQ